jgi:PKD repeat protein
LKYAYYDGSWHNETVDSTGNVGRFTSIALDTSNYPHISYRDVTNRDIKYAYYDGSWHNETVDSPANVGQQTSIALDSSNNPHISYRDVTNEDLKYATADVNQPPTADFTYSPTSPSDMDTIQFTDTSVDVDGTIESWIWDFGDEIGTSTDQNPTYQYTDDGTYTVTLTVTDDDGDTDEISKDIPVSNVPPIAYVDSITPNPAGEYDTVSFNGHGEDTDGTIEAYHWESSIDGPLSAQASFSTSGLSSGTHTISFMVQDDDGAWSTAATEDLLIGENHPPNPLDITGPPSGKAGTSYTYTFTSTDPDGDDVSYYIKWGDEDVTDWTTPQSSGSPGYSESHTWSTQGSYTIEAKAKDTYGAESDWATLSVSMPKNKLLINPKPGYLYASFTGTNGRHIFFFGDLVLFIYKDVIVDAEIDNADWVEFTLTPRKGGDEETVQVDSQDGIFTYNFGKLGIGFYTITADAYQNGDIISSDSMERVFSLSP